MAQTKDKHYWRQLREVLTAGRWDSTHPAKTPKGGPLSWSELLRKFNKHCSGHKDVAEIASQTQALSLLLAANSSDRSLDGNEVSEVGPLALGDECVLAQERVEEALSGYNTLKQLEGSNADSIRLALAYYAYALGRPSECLNILLQAKDITDVQGRVAASEKSRQPESTLRVPGTGSDHSHSSWSSSFVSANSSPSLAEVSDGTTWATTESIRSICLQGMAQERITLEDPQTAFETYATALPLVSIIASEIPASVPMSATLSTNGSGGADNSSFGRYRELWRWVERLIRRAVILGARICDVRQDSTRSGALWELLGHYHTCSAHWPPTFRPDHRSTVCVLHLRAFVLRYGPASVTSTTTSGDAKPHRWISTARSVIQEYRAILSVSTRFPRAGEHNTKVEDLVDLSVAVWEADGAVGEYAGWVIDVLWWATRLTFNSFRVFRHMSRLFYVSGDPELAKRVLRLYVQVVSKSREARMASGNSEQHNAESLLGVGTDTDTDRDWVQTLVQGARMLCRLALTEGDYGQALEEAKEAGVMLEKAKLRLDAGDKELGASVQLAEGIWQSVMAQTEREPLTRTDRLSTSLSLLLGSLETFETPSAHYHLALAYTRPGSSQNLQTAITHARAAVEAEPHEIRYWHLLGLLLSAIEDWTAARAVLEVGAGVGETDDADDNVATQNGTPSTDADGIQARDYAAQDSTAPNGNGAPAINGRAISPDPKPVTPEPEESPKTVIGKDDAQLPPSSALLRPLPERPTASHQEIFEHALQLRMTQLTLVEHVEGPEGAGDRWVEVFQWFSERREVGMDDRRRSIDSRRVSEDLRPPSTSFERRSTADVTDKPLSTVYSHQSNQDVHPDHIPMPPTPIPITVTPASPDEGVHEKRSSSFEDNKTDISRGKKVKEVLRNRVHKGQERITTISKKIGHNVARQRSTHLKRSASAPDLHAVLSETSYQASSIHLRQYLSIHSSQQDLSLPEAPPPPPPSQQSPSLIPEKANSRAAKDRRLLSNLWLMSSATFRRLGKIEQARGAIQEAEVRDEHNAVVWVQLGLYHLALNNERHAVEAFQKALFISPDDVPATIHLCRIYLSPSSQKAHGVSPRTITDNVDLAVGLLSDLTRGVGWDVPEAWYFLGKAYGLQGRKDRERECLCYALTLTETRPLRDVGTALGWCL
ncbi:hypothetical protein CERSUDRAFT_115699 [Gelatoporia subvermispora B]|uniref:TPR-like protein n=1 Tax=Ceriporiopsis subvermispora (strain B) TaxID=914234 RepID=M2RBG4_CERS8|nr:hypothetical protein CERSUDRAFT_115699 [Gelatoporia subvermispora B]